MDERVRSGFTTGILWTAQAVYLRLNSQVGDMYASISIFAIIFQLRLEIRKITVYTHAYLPALAYIR